MPVQYHIPVLAALPRFNSTTSSRTFKTSVQILQGAPRIQTLRLMTSLGARPHLTRSKHSATSPQSDAVAPPARSPTDRYWVCVSITSFVPGTRRRMAVQILKEFVASPTTLSDCFLEGIGSMTLSKSHEESGPKVLDHPRPQTVGSQPRNARTAYLCAPPVQRLRSRVGHPLLRSSRCPNTRRTPRLEKGECRRWGAKLSL